MTSTDRTRISDPTVMRALAHPARLALLEYLSLAEDGATATECAQVVGLSPSATSYHLRALARVGMIREGPGRGDNRERVWQVSTRHFEIHGERDANPDEVAAEQAMIAAYLARQDDKVRRFMASMRDEPPEWFDAGHITDQTLAVTAAELAELLSAIHALVEPLQRLNRTDPPPTARPVSLQLRAFPLPD